MARRRGGKKVAHLDIQLTSSSAEQVPYIHTDMIDVHARTIGAVALGVYSALACHADPMTGESSATRSSIARLYGTTPAGVDVALRRLAAADLITIEERGNVPGEADPPQVYRLLDASAHAVEERRKARCQHG
jgi:hypothetical protein